MMVIDNKFELGQIVYLKTDVEQLARMVVCFQVDNTGVLYELMCGTAISKHYDFEISTEKDYVNK